MHGLSYSEACGIFPDQGLNPCLLPQASGSFTTEAPGKPETVLYLDYEDCHTLYILVKTHRRIHLKSAHCFKLQQNTRKVKFTL